MATEDFKRIVEAMRLPVAVADAKGVIGYANGALALAAGRDAPQLAGQPLTQLFNKADHKRLTQAVARVAEGKAATATLEARLAVEGAERWVQVSLQPTLDARDKAAGVVALLQDIDAQRETEGALNLSAARLLALAEASPVAAMVENSQGEIEIANAAFCALLGLDSAPQSLPGLPAAEILKKAGKKSAALVRHPVVVDGTESGSVWLPRAAEGKGESPDKGPAEIALIQKIGEELSIALEGISAIAIRAQQMEFDPTLVDYFAQIRGSTETAMAAIGDLVDFSRVSGPSVVLHKSRFALRTALAELIARVTPNAEEHDCRLRMKVEQDVSDSLEGDVGRLQLVLKNLLDNAFALLPGSEVTLQIMPEYTTDTGIQLSFAVTQAQAPPFVAPPRGSVDAGMGVAVAKFMVAAMGGKLAIAARVHDETLYAFTVEFPVRPAPPPPRRSTYVSLVGMPVMVVSGDPEQRLALTNLLRGWRLVPLEADNAAMALALLERMDSEGTPVPLVILSNRLPSQDGFLLAFRIKHHRKLGGTLVMMLATQGKAGDAIACRENGISAYMRYPVADRQLNEAILAVTGASVDADETPTLVTRHSLREQRKGATVLLVDPNRDSQILAAHILGRVDCNVVVAQDLTEALAALDQDMYDVVLVDTSLGGLSNPDAAKVLRARITRDPEKTRIVAASLEHSPAWRAARVAEGFDTTMGKPFRKDDLLSLLGSYGRLPVEPE